MIAIDGQIIDLTSAVMAWKRNDPPSHCEIYEQALLMLKTSQAVCYSPKVFEAARELIEQQLYKFPHHDEL